MGKLPHPKLLLQWTSNKVFTRWVFFEPCATLMFLSLSTGLVMMFVVQHLIFLEHSEVLALLI